MEAGDLMRGGMLITQRSGVGLAGQALAEAFHLATDGARGVPAAAFPAGDRVASL